MSTLMHQLKGRMSPALLKRLDKEVQEAANDWLSAFLNTQGGAIGYVNNFFNRHFDDIIAKAAGFRRDYDETFDIAGYNSEHGYPPLHTELRSLARSCAERWISQYAEVLPPLKPNLVKALRQHYAEEYERALFHHVGSYAAEKASKDAMDLINKSLVNKDEAGTNDGADE